MPQLPLLLPAAALGGGYMLWRIGAGAARLARRRHLIEIIEVRPGRGDRFDGFLEAMCTAPRCSWWVKVDGTLGADAEWRLRALAHRHTANVSVVSFAE